MHSRTWQGVAGGQKAAMITDPTGLGRLGPEFGQYSWQNTTSLIMPAPVQPAFLPLQ